ncbi:hypothetical protein LTR82_008786 [Friedmanniomyces endolithicus]|uniref:Uncharacterized protein n=1 Tax=Friedmanniomyces endolithicus TaxID=329885 RepID=A0AAN6JDD4_9PEZI|nr:hypothetical protein LTR82_008786 [Friedmanniomyces endolithicus]
MRPSSDISAILDPAKILIANTPATEMRPCLSSQTAALPSQHRMLNVRPYIHRLSPRGHYPAHAACSHYPPIHPLHPLLLPPLARLDHLQPHPTLPSLSRLLSRLPPSPSSSSSSSSDEEADQINDLILEADAEEICPCCLDRLAWAVWRIPKTKLVLSGHYALSPLQELERRELAGDLREVLGIPEEPVGQEEELLGKAGKNWGGGLRRWVMRERAKDRAEAEAKAEEGRGDGERQ